ncbi:MAG: lactate utilization protein [Ruminococcus sp.]|nr:lactate utilization protein [Ruminococcus sp.]
MNNLQAAFSAAVPNIIKNLAIRNIEAFYYEDSKAMVKDILTKIPAQSSITWGGAESVVECGLMEAIQNGPYVLLDRAVAKTPEEKREFYAKAVMADVFLMSTNAITYQGELINIDGNGNRLACLMQGPKEVFIIVGMNKFVGSIEEGIHRIENIAAPANVQRLHKDTPCYTLGKCAHCFSKESICSHTVITRRSSQPGRIKLFIVPENLGY